MNRRLKQKYGRRFKKKQLWDLDIYLSKFILNNLKAYRELSLNSYPPDLDEDSDDTSIPSSLEIHSMPYKYTEDESIVRWKAIIDKMIWSFNEIAYGFPNEPQTLLYDEYESYIKTVRKEKKYPDSIPDHIVINDSMFREKYPGGAEPIATKEQTKEYNERVNKGLKLFVKYLKDLWD